MNLKDFCTMESKKVILKLDLNFVLKLDLNIDLQDLNLAQALFSVNLKSIPDTNKYAQKPFNILYPFSVFIFIF